MCHSIGHRSKSVDSSNFQLHMNRCWCWVAQDILWCPCPWRVEAERFFERLVLVIFRVWDPILSLPVIATVIIMYIFEIFFKKKNRILSSSFGCWDWFLATKSPLDKTVIMRYTLIVEDIKYSLNRETSLNSKFHHVWSHLHIIMVKGRESVLHSSGTECSFSTQSPLRPLTFTSNTAWWQLCRKGAILIIYCFLLLRREKRGLGRRGSIPEV